SSSVSRKGSRSTRARSTRRSSRRSSKRSAQRLSGTEAFSGRHPRAEQPCDRLQLFERRAATLGLTDIELDRLEGVAQTAQLAGSGALFRVGRIEDVGTPPGHIQLAVLETRDRVAQPEQSLAPPLRAAAR